MDLQQLIQACITGEHDAWVEFGHRFDPLMKGVIVKTLGWHHDRSPELVLDLMQDCYRKLIEDDCSALRKFDHRHENSFFGYIKVIAAHVTLDHLKSRSAGKRGADKTKGDMESAVEIVSSVGYGSVSAMEHEVLMNEIETFLTEHTQGNTGQRDRMIFWLHYGSGVTAKNISRLPDVGLNEKGVESVLYRLTKMVRERLSERASPS